MQTELNGISIKQVLSHPDTVSGITIYSDGTKGYWSEGYAPVVYVKPDGTTWSEDVLADNPTDYHRLALGMGDEFDWDGSTDRDMTHEEAVEYEVICGGMTREEAEIYLNEE